MDDAGSDPVGVDLYIDEHAQHEEQEFQEHNIEQQPEKEDEEEEFEEEQEEEDSDNDVVLDLGLGSSSVAVDKGSATSVMQMKHVFRGRGEEGTDASVQMKGGVHIGDMLPKLDSAPNLLPDIGEYPRVYDIDMESLTEKPWHNPDADITDWFNYGFNDELWKEYCFRQINMRLNLSKHYKGHDVGVGGPPPIPMGRMPPMRMPRGIRAPFMPFPPNAPYPMMMGRNMGPPVGRIRRHGSPSDDSNINDDRKSDSPSRRESRSRSSRPRRSRSPPRRSRSPARRDDRSRSSHNQRRSRSGERDRDRGRDRDRESDRDRDRGRDRRSSRSDHR